MVAFRTTLLVPLLLAAAGGPHLFAPYAAIDDGRPLERLVQATRFGEPGATANLARWLAEHPDASLAERRAGYQALCKAYVVRTLHALRIEACRMAKKSAGEGDDDAGMALAFRNAPPLRTIGSGVVPLKSNPFGTTSGTVEVHGARSDWIMDTGAEITVVSASTAARMGITPLPGTYRVGTSTADVQAPVALIDRLSVGGAIVENVPVLILPDANLAVGGFGQIDGILGLQVFNAFRRVAWLGGGCRLALGDAAPAVTDKRYRLYWHDDGLGAPLETARGIMGGHLDTGANRTDLHADGLALLSAAERGAVTIKTVRTGGAGGTTESRQPLYPKVSFGFGGKTVTVTDLSVSKGGGAARIGMDMVLQFESLTLDFERMTMSVVPKPRAGRVTKRCDVRR